MGSPDTVRSQENVLTLPEFLKLPETKPASEYIDGAIVPKPMPQGKHSRLQAELTGAIDRAVKSRKIACAFPELRCTFGDRSIIPDIAVFRWERIPLDGSGEIANSFPLAPDWTIEILSPEQSQTKVIKNILHCLNHGAQLGWLVDPEEKTVFGYHANREIVVCEGSDTPLPMPAFIDTLNLTIGDLFAWLRL